MYLHVYCGTILIECFSFGGGIYGGGFISKDGELRAASNAEYCIYSSSAAVYSRLRTFR